MTRRTNTPRLARIALLAGLALGALLIAACGGDEPADEPPPRDPPAEAPEPTEQPEGPETETARCESERLGVALEYPADWHTNPAEAAPECSFFDPEPIDVPEATEFFGAAIEVRREPVELEAIAAEDPATRVGESEETEVAGERAIAREIEATGDGLLPAGTRARQYLVDLGGETLLLATYDLQEHDFSQNREVLGEIVETLELNP